MVINIDQIAVPQVREILTNYGKDIPAVVCGTRPTGMNRERAEKLYQVTQKLRPGLIQNNRLGGGFKGDTETPEQYIPAQGYPGRDWETCMTMNNTWGFKRDDNDWKSTETNHPQSFATSRARAAIICSTSGDERGVDSATER